MPLNNIIQKLLVSEKELIVHSVNVSCLATKFGRYIGLHEADVNHLKLGGFLHDIGKIKLDSNVLFKQGKLTDEEYALVKHHPKIGYNMLLDTEISKENAILDIVLEHHERPDGKGYPRGISKISKLAKIVSICDVYDVITSERSYKIARDDNVAFHEIKNGLGKQFDEELGLLFLEMMNETTVKKIS